MSTKILTLCLLVDKQKILLGLKKRGFGQGKWNGFGGKLLMPRETIEQAAKREFEEESGLSCKQLEKRGILQFHGEIQDMIAEVHIFSVLGYSGTMKENEEMRPQWFDLDKIPYDQMWLDDPYWLPVFLKEQKFRGTFWYEGTEKLIKQEVAIIENI